jgi:hypothetical protein
VATEAPKPNPAGAPQAGGQNAPQTSGISAPTPVDATSTPKETVLSVPDAEALAASNDIRACQDASRKLRMAGVAVPPPLLALTALDLKFHNPQPQP